MHASLISIWLAIGEAILCLGGITCILVRKQGHNYKFLCAFLGFHAASGLIWLPLFLFSGRGIAPGLTYKLYFYSYWAAFAIESLLELLLIYSIFDLAMAPLEGLQRLGTIMFRWVASISVAIALSSVFSPNMTQVSVIIRFVSELQRTQSILTLCLLLFVCFAIRPLGLTYSSRIFGVSLGLGILASTNLVASAWISHFKQMYTIMSTGTSVATWLVLVLWIVYFSLPEPKRRIVVLPTTSPFLRWNQISLVLGDEPGFVAISGVPPDLFAPAELEIMRRASLQMVDEPVTTP